MRRTWESRLNRAEKAYTSRKRKKLATGGPTRPAPSRRRKALTGDHPVVKALAGGVKGKPHSSKEGRLASAKRKFGRIVKDSNIGKKVSPAQPDLSQIKKHMKKYKTPLKSGGRAKKPRPQGPHMWVRGDKRKKYAEGGSVGAAVRGKGCEIK
jgi:hypothetical protein